MQNMWNIVMFVAFQVEEGYEYISFVLDDAILTIFYY